MLAEQKPKYIIRADVKSFYKSIQHHLLIQDVKRYYSDPHVQSMLENIIKNPIETPRGYKNPDNVSQNSFDSANQKQPEQYLTSMGGGRTVRHQLVIQILCIKRSFRMRERYEMRANKLNKWLLMESLSAESGVT